MAIPYINKIPQKAHIAASIKKEEEKYLFQSANRIHEWVGKAIAKNFFFPWDAKKEAEKEVQAKKPSAIEDFWGLDTLDTHFPEKEAIKQYYEVAIQCVEVKHKGKTLKMKCLVIEPKDKSLLDKCVNHMIIQGNSSTLSNNPRGYYPFLEADVRERRQDPNHPPSRFIIFDHYDNTIVEEGKEERPYLPKTMDEWGLLCKLTVQSLVNTYGEFSLMSAHSLGNFPMVAYLKFLDDDEFLKLFPKTLFLAQGPSSIYEVSKNVPLGYNLYPWGWFLVIGLVLYLLAKWTNWTLELDQTIVDRLNKLPDNEEMKKKKEEMQIVISGVKKESFFPGESSLVASKKLDQLKTGHLHRVMFDPSVKAVSPTEQHSHSLRYFHTPDLINVSLRSHGQDVFNLTGFSEIDEAVGNQFKLFQKGDNLASAVCGLAWGKRDVINLNAAAAA